MAKATTERVAVWLTPEQVAWLKTKENVSMTLRGLVNEAMNMQRLADSLKQKGARKAAGAAKATAQGKSAKLAPSATVQKAKAPVIAAKTPVNTARAKPSDRGKK
jgi:hypothetical protein